MTVDAPESNPALLAHLLVPVANVDDARATGKSLSNYDPDEVTVLHVIEKGDGVPDKTPVEQSRELAKQSFSVFREHFPDANEQITFNRDVVEAIIEVATELEVSAIAFQPRGGSRIVKFLSGDQALRLITESTRPVVCLPTVKEQ